MEAFADHLKHLNMLVKKRSQANLLDGAVCMTLAMTSAGGVLCISAAASSHHCRASQGHPSIGGLDAGIVLLPWATSCSAF